MIGNGHLLLKNEASDLPAPPLEHRGPFVFNQRHGLPGHFEIQEEPKNELTA